MCKEINILVIDDVSSERANIRTLISVIYECLGLLDNKVSSDGIFEEYFYKNDNFQLRIIELLEIDIKNVESVISQNIDRLSCIIFDMAWNTNEIAENYNERFIMNSPEEMKDIFNKTSHTGQIDNLIGGLRFLYYWNKSWGNIFATKPQLISKSVYFNDALKQLLKYLGVLWIIDNITLNDENVFNYVIINALMTYNADCSEYEFLKKFKNNDFIAEDENSKKLLLKIKSVVKNNNPVLLIGENGSGKEFCAKYLHQIGNRKSKPFNTFISDGLIEEYIKIEIFGICKSKNPEYLGDEKGIFEKSNGGSIYFDKIENWSPKIQGYINTILQTRKIRTRENLNEIDIDIKIISSTSCSIQKLRDLGFNEDLLSFLRSNKIVIPSLRERKRDIKNFITFFSKKEIELTTDALDTLLLYDWPRNIAELKQVVLEILNENEDIDIIHFSDLPAEIRRTKEKTFWDIPED